MVIIYRHCHILLIICCNLCHLAALWYEMVSYTPVYDHVLPVYNHVLPVYNHVYLYIFMFYLYVLPVSLHLSHVYRYYTCTFVHT